MFTASFEKGVDIFGTNVTSVFWIRCWLIKLEPRQKKFMNKISVVVVLSCLCIFSNFVQNRQQDLYGNKNLKLEATNYVFERPRKNLLSPMQRSINFNTTTDKQKSRVLPRVPIPALSNFLIIIIYASILIPHWSLSA